MKSYCFQSDVIGMPFCQCTGTTVGYSLVAVVTGLCRYLTYSSRETMAYCERHAPFEL